MTVTAKVPVAVGVPEMVPVVGSTLSPAGRPVAAKVTVVVGDESVASIVTGVAADPDTSVWLPGLVSTTVLVTVHANDVEPA